MTRNEAARHPDNNPRHSRQWRAVFLLLAFMPALGCGSGDNGDSSAGVENAPAADVTTEPAPETSSPADGGIDDVAVTVNDLCETMSAIENDYPWKEWLNALPGERLAGVECESSTTFRPGRRGHLGSWDQYLMHPDNTYTASPNTAGFALDLSYVPACSEEVRASEGDPPGNYAWCTAEQTSNYFGPMSSGQTSGGIPYRVVDHTGGARLFVGDYELYFNRSHGNFEFERTLVEPSNPAGVSDQYVGFIDAVIDNLFVRG